MSHKYQLKGSEVYNINTYISRYGNISLSRLKEILLDGRKYLCPKCKGRGYVKTEYNGYPSGLPDSMFVYEAAYKDIKCDLCNGMGYTYKKMIPNFIQQGWKEESE